MGSAKQLQSVERSIVYHTRGGKHAKILKGAQLFILTVRVHPDATCIVLTRVFLDRQCGAFQDHFATAPPRRACRLEMLLFGSLFGF